MAPKKQDSSAKVKKSMAKGKTSGPHNPRNRPLTKAGLMKYSRGRIFQKKAVYKLKKVAKKPVTETKKVLTVSKPVGGDKNGGKREVLVHRKPGSYPTQEARRSKTQRPVKTFKQHVRRLRPSLTPGTVVILLAGRHKGKRVVFLRQLASGLLLISGPMKLNGCPLRRVHQRYVIATQTKMDISTVKLPERLNDEYFKRQKESKKKSSNAAGGDIFAKEKVQYQVTPERKEDQTVVDKQLTAVIKSQPDRKALFQYVKSLFSLKNGQHPHNMIF